MCCVSGFYSLKTNSRPGREFLLQFCNLLKLAEKRGRDGWGFYAMDPRGGTHSARVPHRPTNYLQFESRKDIELQWLISNHRAEPSSVYVKSKTYVDQQPYVYNDVVAVHNGMIENASALFKRYKFEPPGGKIDSWAVPVALSHGDMIPRELKGSMAIAAVKLNEYKRGFSEFWLYRDYQPLHVWYNSDKGIIVFCSLSDAVKKLDGWWTELPFPPYSRTPLTHLAEDFQPQHWKPMPLEDFSLRRFTLRRTVVLFSGGLDTTVVATEMCEQSSEVLLLYFRYGHLAEEAEYRAVSLQAEYFARRYPDKKIRLHVVDQTWLAKLGGSRLFRDSAPDDNEMLDHSVPSAWVPARNTLMMAVAAAFCDAWGYDTIAAGLNLEEAGSYPDNSEPYTEIFESLLAHGTISRPEIVCPVLDMMKPEIVRRGLEQLHAPFHLSWSCYRGGANPCGQCGPCYRRRVAFEIVGVSDPAEVIANPVAPVVKS